MQFEAHITVDRHGISVLQLVSEQTELSNHRIKTALTSGCTWHESTTGIRRIRRAKKVLAQGDRIHLYYDDAVLDAACEPATLIADEQDYSVWYKPPGMFSQGSKWGDHCTLYRYAEQNLEPQRPAFIVHRLDRATSGLMLLAHSKKTAKLISGMFESRAITKRYYAIVEGTVDDIDIPFMISNTIDGKPARSEILDYTVYAGHTLLDLELHTGRKHQLRRHLAGIGYPITGDRLYANNRTGDDASHPDLQLQCYYLAFQCPITHQQRSYRLDRSLSISQWLQDGVLHE